MTAATKLSTLSQVEIDNALTQLPGWQVTSSGVAINKQFKFKDYAAALVFVNALSPHAEEANHHPDMTLGWGYVGITLTTHDAGGVTENDIALAKTINGLQK